MTKKQGDKILGLLQKFIKDNHGQIMTDWNSGSLFGLIKKEVDGVIEQDSETGGNNSGEVTKEQ